MGKRALAQAAQRCGDAITVRYRRRPFILRPERIGMEPWLGVLRKLGVSRGNPDWVNSFVPAMVAKGKQLGIAFDFGGNVGNSLDSLRLLHFAVVAGGGDDGLQERLADVLARQHFEQKQCVGDHAALLRACAEAWPRPSGAAIVGDDGGVAAFVAACKAVLDDPSRYAADVMRAIDDAHAKGHHSIPVFTFCVGGFVGADAHADAGAARAVCELHGAASPEEFVEALQFAASEA